jgi:hypothetical protein
MWKLTTTSSENVLPGNSVTLITSPTDDQIDDGFTKALSVQKSEKFMGNLNLGKV